MSQSLHGIARLARNAHPQHIDGRAEIFYLQAGLFANDRTAAVRANHELSTHFERAELSFRAYSGDAVAVDNQISDFSLHAQIKFGIAFGVVGHEIQEIPLRHQGDKFAVRGEMSEISDCRLHVANLHANITKLVVRKLQELVEKSKVMQRFERGGMDRVTAKIAQKIRVFFENQHFDASSRQQISQHHSRRAAAGDAATHVEFLNGGILRHGR